MKRVGAIPSTYPAAEAALASDVSLLVFPGGDIEAMRPIWQANQVQFGGRQGFLKIARKAQVPIVPMGIAGSHYTAPVLWRSERMLPWLLVVPRLSGMKRYALTLLGVLGCILIFLINPFHSVGISIALSWLWLVLPMHTLPWIPWSIRVKIGEPISPQDLFGNSREKSLGEAYSRVQGAVQNLLG
jgi:1-acyl-sn-glycerol-3-phosphate acyltransferase